MGDIDCVQTACIQFKLNVELLNDNKLLSCFVLCPLNYDIRNLCDTNKTSVSNAINTYLLIQDHNKIEANKFFKKLSLNIYTYKTP